MKAFIVTGLLYGDEGKGTVVDALTQKYDADLIIRHNGGGQAAHTVITDRGAEHTFRQFGSGSFNPKTRTFLSKHMIVNPLTMVTEAMNLPFSVLDRTFIDERALVTTPYHRALNRLRELSRGGERHGSVGFGVGETRADSIARGGDVLRAGDLRDDRLIYEKLEECRRVILKKVEALTLDMTNAIVQHELSTFSVDLLFVAGKFQRWKKMVNILSPLECKVLLDGSRMAIFEGAQGVLLDETWGFPPYNTWTNTTSKNAYEILDELDIFCEWTKEVGVLRAFSTRHGPGPFPTENSDLEAMLKVGENNKWNEWQTDFRYGWLDMAALKYALAVNGGVDYLAVTHVDKLKAMPSWIVGDHYHTKLNDETAPTEETTAELLKREWTGFSLNAEHVVTMLSEELRTPLLLDSHGPKYKDKRFTHHHEKLLIPGTKPSLSRAGALV